MADGDYVETDRQISVQAGDVIYQTSGVATTRTSSGFPYKGKAMAGIGSGGINQTAAEFTMTDTVPVCAGVSFDEKSEPGRIRFNCVWKQPIPRSKSFSTGS